MVASGAETEHATGPEAGPCPVCGEAEILLPYTAVPCCHVFCYYCLRSNTEADTRYRCPRCLTRVTAMRRRLPAAVPAPAAKRQHHISGT